ncbi:MAG TPA: CHAD domain-containing protein [Bacteroidota bacterium]|nr:CHAD domain-containing protein [Bacteroidota bacterium]
MAKPWKIVDLDPEESLKVCLHKIALTRFQETFSYETGTVKGDDIEALHDMRVAARRLRAVLRIFRDCFSKKKFKKHDARLQSLIRSLGAVREHDVFIELLSTSRANLEPADRKVIDLLIARETTARMLHRRNLVRELKALGKSKFGDSFAVFAKSTL